MTKNDCVRHVISLTVTNPNWWICTTCWCINTIATFLLLLRSEKSQCIRLYRIPNWDIFQVMILMTGNAGIARYFLKNTRYCFFIVLNFNELQFCIVFGVFFTFFIRASHTSFVDYMRNWNTKFYLVIDEEFDHKLIKKMQNYVKNFSNKYSA